MSIAEVVQLVTALAALVAATASIIAAIKIQVVHKATNSMHDEIVRVTAKSSKAEGKKEAQEEAKGNP